MLKGINTIADSFLADLNRIQDRQIRVQNQISSGHMLERPSDAPERVVEIFRLQSLVQHNKQVDENLTGITAEVDTAEAAVRQAIEMLERADSLAVQNAGNNPDIDRSSAAIEVKSLHEELVNLSRTSARGRYVFSGDLDQTLLYTSDWTKAGGVAQATDSGGLPIVAANTRLVADNLGARFSISRSSHQIFDMRNADGTPAANNVFQAVYELGQALEADDNVAVANTLPKLRAALDHINGELAFFGNAQNRVQAAVDATKKEQLALSKKLSDQQDTDIASALIELNQVNIQQQTAFAAHSQLPRTSLFDFLG